MARTGALRAPARWGAAVVGVALLAVGCSSSGKTTTTTTSTTRGSSTTTRPTTTAPVTTTPVTTVPATTPRTTAAPVPTDAPAQRSSVSYANCTAARAAGVTPLHRGDPGYSSSLDRDNDGIACE